MDKVAETCEESMVHFFRTEVLLITMLKNYLVALYFHIKKSLNNEIICFARIFKGNSQLGICSTLS